MENQAPPATLTPPPGPPPFQPAADARQKVSAPAMALIISAIIGFIVQFLYILALILFTGRMDQFSGVPFPEGMESLGSLTSLITGLQIGMNIFLLILSLVSTVIIIFGGIRMRNLQSWGLALTAAILAIAPCFNSCCCILNMPIGIWALVVLLKPEMKAAFK